MSSDKSAVSKRVSDIHELLKQVCQKMTEAYSDGIKIEFSINTNSSGESTIARFEAFEKIKLN